MHTKSIPNSAQGGGFSLLELLVVVAVLTLLLALLGPALAAARARADAPACLNNARQLILAWSQYSDDNAQHLVINADGVLGGFTNWVAGNMKEPADFKDPDLLVDHGRSLLATYIRAPRIFKCPTDESLNVRSVAMNCRLNPVRESGPVRWVHGYGDQFVIFRSTPDIGSPSTVFVTIEEADESINDGYFAVDLSDTGTEMGEGRPNPHYLVDWPSVRHNRAAALSFADGHAELHRWKEIASYGPPKPLTHVPSGSADLAWLQSRSSYRR